MNLKMVLRRNEDIVSRDIEGQIIIMPLHKSSKELNCIYTLNESAAAAWEMIDGKNDLAKIKEELLNKFDVSEKTIERQLSCLVKDLKSIKAIY
ncbi:MAG: PqqD family protein [Candidatus Omnitrophota bacterium]